MRSGVARAFDRWIGNQDESLAREASSPRAWLTSTLFVCAFLPFLSYAPGAHDYFGLRFRPALLCYLPAVLLAMVFAVWTRNRRPFTRWNWIVYLIDSSALQFFCASLITWCSPNGAAAVSSLFIFAAAYHGHVMRVTLGEPFLAVGTLLAVLGAALLDDSGERHQLFAFAGGAALTIELLIGTNARRWHLARRATEQLRAALAANILDQQDRRMTRLADTLVEMLARNHDLNNSLMALRLAADAVKIESQRRGVTGIDSVLADLQECVARIVAYVEETKKAGHHEVAAAETEVVDVLPLTKTVLRSVRARFPGTRCTLGGDGSTPLRSPLRGGAVTLRRILENLLINACEGDGRRGATEVEIAVFRDPSGGRIQIVISDNGPGFSEEQLAREIEVFASGKAEGSGLGLYTCERLLRASGGQLHRANLPDSGARLTAILPLVGS